MAESVPTEFLMYMQSGVEERGEICAGPTDEIADPVLQFLRKTRDAAVLHGSPDGCWDEEIGGGVPVAKTPGSDFMTTKEQHELRKRITRCVNKTIDGFRWRYGYDAAGELIDAAVL